MATLKTDLGGALGHENQRVHRLTSSSTATTLLGKVNYTPRDVNIQDKDDARNVHARTERRRGHD
ncbi:hypothetical protein LTS17_009377 [Exophiala oligosperma]